MLNPTLRHHMAACCQASQAGQAAGAEAVRQTRNPSTQVSRQLVVGRRMHVLLAHRLLSLPLAALALALAISAALAAAAADALFLAACET